MKIHDKYNEELSVQSYGHKSEIAGVELIALSLQGDDGGNFCELARISNGHIEGTKEPFEVRQVSMSIMTPNTIKAYHIHKNQDDMWYTNPFDRLIVNLHDLREDSPTFDTHIKLILGGGKNLMLRIPHGVAHGAANMYERNMTLYYFTNQQFQKENPDEFRLPWDSFGKDAWEITKG